MTAGHDDHDDDFKALLEAMRRDVLSTRDVRDESSETVALDQSRVGRLSRMDAMQNQAMAVAGKARAEQRLRLIDAALQRIKTGDYGDCMECGEAINPKRLEVDPTALYCIECARLH